GGAGGLTRRRHHRGRGHPQAAPAYGLVGLWPPSGPSRVFWKLRGKIGTWAVISSNSENISLLGFLKPKTAENRNWHFGILLIDMASPINFNQFLEKEKLKSNGSNFTDWFRHVRIFLNGGNLQYVLDAPLGDPPAETETDEVKNVYATRKTRYSQVQCAILCSLEADLQKRFEHHDPHELVNELKTIFETHAAVECYEASKHFFSCMMEEGSSVSEHMLAMTGHAKKLSDLGIVIPNRLGINRVLQSLPPSYKNFVMNYNMQNMNKELPELFAMLKSAEIEIKKEHQVLMVNKTTSFKKQGKSKGKNKKSGKKAATPPVKPKTGPKPDAECYYCKEKGHWKRNCSKYLADLKSGLVKKKKEGAEDSDRLSAGLPLKDLEKLVRRFTSLNKGHAVPSLCRVEPFSGSHALPENHQDLSSLPPLPEGGEVDERAIVRDDSQDSSMLESEPAASRKIAGSSDEEAESEQRSDSTHSISPPPIASPDGRKRKRNDDENSGASKLAEPAAEESSPDDLEAFDPFSMTGVVSS
ncbi:hypothetical protein QYE76_052490, partial [Lolium multiflorum]